MAKPKYAINEKSLTKGELRKLNALRKSLGDEIADEAFSKWYEQRPTATNKAAQDPNIGMIEGALEPLREQMKFPRGGRYIVKKGRGRIVVTPLE